jgi:PKD repeat protein
VVNYRGHGSSTAWASSNGLNTNDVMNLENGNMLPVVHSIACYNNQIDFTGGDCLGEAFLKSPNGGAVSHLSASRPSYTIQNHDFDKYLFEATYMDEMKVVGEVINIAKIDLLNQYGTGGAAETNVWMYFQFGDPETPLVSFEPPEHEIAVKNLVAPSYMLANETADISAGVYNMGKNNETNIEVQFLVDNDVKDTTIIDFLASGDSTITSFPWTPTSNGEYLVGIKALPVPGEGNTDNNLAEKYILVSPEIKVSDLLAPEKVEPYVTSTISAIVSNPGKSDEPNVEVEFLVDGVIQETRILNLPSGSWEEVSFEWTPIEYPKWYNICIHAIPVPDEYRTTNNEQQKDILVKYRPVADAGPDQESFSQMTITFDGSNSYDHGAIIVEYKWAFGDGSTAYGVIVDHSYSSTKQYTATLTIKNEYGETDSDTCIVKVWERGHDIKITSFRPSKSARLGTTKDITVKLKNVGTYEEVPMGSSPDRYGDYVLVTLYITKPDGTKTTQTTQTRIYLDNSKTLKFSLTFDQRGEWTHRLHIDICDANGNINPFPYKDQNPADNDMTASSPTNVK